MLIFMVYDYQLWNVLLNSFSLLKGMSQFDKLLFLCDFILILIFTNKNFTYIFELSCNNY